MLATTNERPEGSREQRVNPESATVDAGSATVHVAVATDHGQEAPVDPDRAAFEDAAAGDTRAFEVLVLRYQARIVNYASAMVRDAGAAEDVAQETFVRAWRGMGRFRGESSFKTWLYRIATNVARTHLDRHGRQARIADRSLDDEAEPLQAGDVPSPAPDAETSLVRREAIDRALSELPDELRLALVLRDVEGLDYKEIAGVTGAPIGTVESRIFRARRRLRTLLRPLVTG
jgi:RNA polymerase sigma-70 factor (ECF subfamily)